ncbi:serine/threonine-protein kinase [Polyangium aurulentum]|uniref:serine/threonine-protein kinase n=1 Tax=Polyangium aurulentum TaxID=2567896 RepID=UPI0010AE7A48|nr:serine/threonine-protein kinase [Polyangium aurulentum]UQA56957.1 protein kinase [Polyangium aurulentum]
MRIGDVIDDRFEILKLAGAGGMGTVYRALDRVSGAAVAVKVVHDASGEGTSRFAKEARLLAGLRHPHIVEYVADSIAPTGEPYLVMEWLEGESLDQRLQRQGLQFDESLVLARRVAGALGAAHEKGVTHRDIKPSNLFLADGAVDRVKVLDFGIAQLAGATTALTRTGTLLGTPGYMAPEQARGERGAIDARADVFSLGCVLFECLTGRPAFVGMHVMALLAKLLLEEAPRVRALRPEVPEELDALVARMLAKDPAERPADGAALAAALEELHVIDGRAASAHPKSQASLTGTETRFVSVVALGPAGAGVWSRDATLAHGLPPRVLGEVRCAVEPLGVKVEELVNGVLVAVVSGAGTPTDLAALGARCALRMRELVPDAALVLLSGRAQETGRLPVGEVLERAASMISTGSAQAGEDAPYRAIQIDEVTRALLDVRFDVVEVNRRILLLGERDVGGEARVLLGKPSPFVGRDREMRTLLDLVEESFEEEKSRVVLVTGPAGIGKSRLRHELSRRLKDSRPDLVALVGRADSVGAGSAFAMLGSAFRSSLGIAGGETLEAQQEKLARFVNSAVKEAERQRVLEFIGEMIGTPFPDEGSPRLRAARQDASRMAEQFQCAFTDIIRAHASARPVMLVLEDLHWGDIPSVKLVDVALRELPEQRFVVVAFARPEVQDRFPKLWAERDVQEIRLRELGRRAAESLVRSALGPAVTEETVALLVDRAAGNAFYLEELIRTVAEGRGDALPETVLGMVAARLSMLDAEARRVLRAASIFGETFWRGGVWTLVGEELGAGRRDWLAELVEKEIVSRRQESRIAHEEEYAFRHALLREGAYATLTERDRTLGHKLAGEWLEGAGETDPSLLGEHFDRGGEGARAAAYHLDAAEQALEGRDSEAALRLVERGIALGVEPELRAGLWAVEAEARSWMLDREGALRSARAALSLARAGSRIQSKAAVVMVQIATIHGRLDWLDEAMERLLHVDPEPDAISPFAAAIGGGVPLYLAMMQRGSAEQCIRRIEQVALGAIERDAIALACISYARAYWNLHAERDPWSLLENARAAAFHLERSGDRSLLPWVQAIIPATYVQLGVFDRAEEEFSRILGDDLWRRGSLDGKIARATEVGRAGMLLGQGKPDEALALATRMMQEAKERGELGTVLNGQIHLVTIHLRRGSVDAAEAEATAFGELASQIPMFALVHLILLARVRLAQGRLAEAAAIAERALAESRSSGLGYLALDAAVLLVRAEALHALGDHAAARRSIGEARDDLLGKAAKIPDPEVRRSFLEDLADHRRTLALAQEWLGAPEHTAAL